MIDVKQVRSRSPRGSTGKHLYFKDFAPAPTLSIVAEKHRSIVSKNGTVGAVQIDMAARAVLILALSALLCAGHGAAAAQTLQQTADLQQIVDALSPIAADPPTAAALVSTCEAL